MSKYTRHTWKKDEVIDEAKLNNIEEGIAEAKEAAANAETAANKKAPAYTYGTTDLIAGVTPLETGKLHFVYE